MSSLSIAEMRKWLANKDPKYGGHPNWARKVKNWSDNQVLAVYHSRQNQIAKDKAKAKVTEAQKEGIPLIVDDVKPPKRENYKQLTLMDIFKDQFVNPV